MRRMSGNTPLPKDLVLIGGGHTHVQVLRHHLMKPLENTRITLVVDDPVAVYSGMVPGLVAGQYARHEVEIDVRPLARRGGIRVIQHAAVSIDTSTQRVSLQDRPDIRYDIASINVGSTVRGLDVPGVRQHAVATRPITALVRTIEERTSTVPTDRRATAVVVGAGAAGVELAFAIHRRITDITGNPPIVHIVSALQAPMGGAHPRIGARILTAMRDRDITFVGSRRATEVSAAVVTLDDGTSLPADITLWATGGGAHPWLARSGLPVDDNGFVLVDRHLRVQGTANLFAAGDCIAFPSPLVKAGVYAVREGPVLIDNLRASLQGEALSVYKPQSDFLALINTCDGHAIATKWGVALTGAAAFAHKDRIDRAFMDKFQVLGPDGSENPAFQSTLPSSMAQMDPEDMVCGGCAAKVGQPALSQALASLPASPVPDDVLVGLDAPDDAAIISVNGAQLAITTDTFPAPIDDPWTTGVLAGTNALSDLFATGVAPTHALAMVQVPYDEDAGEVLRQVMHGITTVLKRHRVALIGGHTTVGPNLTAGLVALGNAAEVPWTISGFKPNDWLVLTRPLGTGMLLHADMRGAAAGPDMAAALRWMKRGNGPSFEAARPFAIQAATDITGFGLAGHLGAAMRASGTAATVALDHLPVLHGVSRLLQRGERSTFHASNRAAMRTTRIEIGCGLGVEILFDPQTSGGLLFGVDSQEKDALIAALIDSGDEPSVIGRVLEPDPEGVLITVTPHPENPVGNRR